MRAVALLVTLASSFSCLNREGSQATPEKEPLSVVGKRIYLGHCSACHATDPKKDGSLGPAVWGVSKELLRARVLKAEYPPGYKPKRQTKLMTPLPHMEGDIDSLHAFLNE